jgi:long-chain acyl-CoA synthetase
MVTLINKFTVAGESTDFERIWQESSEFMRQQPGFISFRLVRSLNNPQVYINIAEWADAESHQRVVGSPNFQQHIAELAAVATPEPNLCEVVIAHASAS